MSYVVVCATDYSRQADAALAWAGALARRGGGRVDLVHVARPYHEDSRTMVFEAALVDAAKIDATRAHLREVAESASRELGVEVRPHVLRGEPHEEILAHARREDAGLVVLGTTSLVRIERWVIGSVAERTVRMADRPVVLVPRREDPSPWRADAPRPPRVLVALGENDDVSGLRFATDLRRAGPCDVTCTRVYWPAVEYARLGLTGPRNPMAPDPDVVRSFEPAMRRKMEALTGPGQTTVDVRPAWGDTTSALLFAAEACEADLLVVGVERRWRFGRALTSSIAEQVARVSRDLPIACIPREVGRTEEGVPNVRTVLAVTDLSALGNAAVPHAYALLRGRGGVVELCYVRERALPSPSQAYEAPAWRLSDAERASLVEQLRALIPREAESLDVTTQVSVVDGGRAAEAIAQLSERLNVDVICLASHGRGGLAHTVLGSVASEVIQRVRRPVFVVRRPAGRE
jgi:nucleotide-binding universal stress UspA family protein